MEQQVFDWLKPWLGPVGNLTWGIVASIVGALLAAIAQAFIGTEIFFRWRARRQEPTLDAELASTLRALEENSNQAIGLLTRLQSEVNNRTQSVREIETRLEQLRQQRTLLDLTDEQKAGLAGLVRRKPTAVEIFSSLDFWLGRVTPATVFFLLGIVVTLLLRR